MHRSRDSTATKAKRSSMPNMPARPRPAPRSSWPPARYEPDLRPADRDTESGQRANPPAIISMSYGECEASTAPPAMRRSTRSYQTGVAEGMSIFVGAGDRRRGGMRYRTAQSQRTASPSMAWPPRLTTLPSAAPISATPMRGPTVTYWNSSNTATYGSAISYIPEIPWNSYLRQPTVRDLSRLQHHLRLVRLLQQHLSRRPRSI